MNELRKTYAREIHGESFSCAVRFLHTVSYDGLNQDSKRNECLTRGQIQHFSGAALAADHWIPDREFSQISECTSDAGISLSLLPGPGVHRRPVNRRRSRPRKLSVTAILIAAVVVLLGNHDRLVPLLVAQSTTRRRFAVHATGNYMTVAEAVRSMGRGKFYINVCQFKTKALVGYRLSS